jgi:hypothetical protein
MIRRNIEDHLVEAMRDTPVVLLHGGRQTGKTTLVKRMAQRFPGSQYVTLDDAGALSLAVRDPLGFLQGLPSPAVIDEVQKAPQLFPAIKMDVDRRRRPGRFLLTGSANVFLLPRLAESLAGRMEPVPLYPFSQGELAGRRERFIERLFSKAPLPRRPIPAAKPTLTHRVSLGGFPEVRTRTGGRRRSAWFNSYVSTVLQRDVRDLAHIEGLSALPNLLTVLASRSSGLLNLADVARSTGLPHMTLKRYFTLLETLFLVLRLPSWHANIGKRLTKAPKIHLCDSGLACHVLGCDADRLRRDPSLFGPLLESFAAIEIVKQASWCVPDVRPYFFRTSAGTEVDILLEDRRGRIAAIEVKASSTIGAREFQGLDALADALGPRLVRGVVLYQGGDILPRGQRLCAVPLQALWEW